MKTGWQVNQSFQITLHQKDKALLEQIQSLFCVGSINSKHGLQVIVYSVQSIKDLKVIIDHFDRFPLLTQKRADFELFKMAFKLIESKAHLTAEGLAKIVSIKASMNKGLLRTNELKAAFPGIIPVLIPSAVDKEMPKNPNWLAGFTSGEGCFFINIMNSTSNCLGFQVKLMFLLTQHIRDEQLMRSLVDYLDCGNVYKNRETVDFKITKFNDLTNKVIPFFQKYPLQGVKSKDFKDFCKVAELMENKAHLTAEGLDQIRQTKAGMNTGRKFEA